MPPERKAASGAVAAVIAVLVAIIGVLSAALLYVTGNQKPAGTGSQGVKVTISVSSNQVGVNQPLIGSTDGCSMLIFAR